VYRARLCGESALEFEKNADIQPQLHMNMGTMFFISLSDFVFQMPLPTAIITHKSII